MRRDRIIEAMGKLKEALQLAQIRDVINTVRNEQQTVPSNRIEKILSAYSIFSQHHIEFGEEEKHLMTLFGLNPLVNVNFWSGLLESNQNTPRKTLTDVDVGVYNIMFVVPKLKELLVRQTDTEDLIIKLEDGVEREVKRFRVFIGEQGSSLTETFVVSSVLKAVEELYETMFYLHKQKFVALTIGGIDSGSSKVIDFYGVSEVIADILSVLSDVWVRVKHATGQKMRYQIEVALMSSGFIARVNEAQRSSYISEEEGQRITRTIAKSIEALLRNGAYTDEMEEVSDVRASDILHRRTEMIEYQQQPVAPTAPVMPPPAPEVHSDTKTSLSQPEPVKGDKGAFSYFTKPEKTDAPD